MAHCYNPIAERLEQGDHKFQGSLVPTGRFLFQKKKKKNKIGAKLCPSHKKQAKGMIGSHKDRRTDRQTISLFLF